MFCIQVFLAAFLSFTMFPSLVMSQSFLATKCEDNTFANYTAGSKFQNNLNRLLASLFDHGSSSNSDQATEGSYPDKVYTVSLYAEVIFQKTLARTAFCIDVANGRILSDCQYKKEGAIWPVMSSAIHMLGTSGMPIPQPAEPAFSVGRVVPFSQLQTIELGSSGSVPSSHVKSNEIETSESLCDLTISETLPR
ncbi:hypothetical protein ACET3Z_032269 [Daucus carota]